MFLRGAGGHVALLSHVVTKHAEFSIRYRKDLATRTTINAYVNNNQNRPPDDVVVAPGAVAPRFLVALFEARIVLNHVAGRPFLYLDTLVPAGQDGVLAHQVVVAPVLSVRLPLRTEG